LSGFAVPIGLDEIVLDESQSEKNQSEKNQSEKDTDDHALVQECLQGNRQSFRILYGRHQQRVRGILYQLGGAATLDDLVQEVFLRAWKGLPKFRRSAKFSTWLYRIAWNVASDQRQAIARGRTQLQVLTTHAGVQHTTPDVMHLHYQDLVQRGLISLSFDHRAVLTLHDLEEIPQKEIAEILQIPLGTVKSRLFHARAAMRQFLDHEGVQL
jgi:RNA polymerase sigma factor (sigma-70 family)